MDQQFGQQDDVETQSAPPLILRVAFALLGPLWTGPKARPINPYLPRR